MELYVMPSTHQLLELSRNPLQLKLVQFFDAARKPIQITCIDEQSHQEAVSLQFLCQNPGWVDQAPVGRTRIRAKKQFVIERQKKLHLSARARPRVAAYN